MEFPIKLPSKIRKRAKIRNRYNQVPNLVYIYIYIPIHRGMINKKYQLKIQSFLYFDKKSIKGSIKPVSNVKK